MLNFERPRRAGAAHLRIVARNDGPLGHDAVVPARMAYPRGGGSWYHEEAVRQERQINDRGLPRGPRPVGPPLG